jgi:membrane fusion protein (multidrug efflux system)
MANNNGNGGQPQPKKRSKVFLIILIVLVIAGGWFGISKWNHAQHHMETDDAQVEANISPIIPRVSGYVKEVRVSDNQKVKKGDTLLILDDRDLRIKLEEAEAALATAESNLVSAEAATAASRSNIGTSQAAILAVDAQIEKAKVNVWQTTQEFDRYANLIRDHSVTQQQFEDKQAAKGTGDKAIACYGKPDQGHFLANQYCRFNCQATAGGCGQCQVEFILYDHYISGRRSRFKSKCAGGPIPERRPVHI